MDDCIFDCGDTQAGKPLITAGPDRVRSIIEASKSRQDDKHKVFERRANAGELKYHKNCVSSYTSRSHIDRYLKRLSADSSDYENAPSSKRLRSFETKQFDFRLHCLFCGENCVMDYDRKNPTRWRRTVLCRTTDHGEQQTFKEAILDKCESRQDEHGLQVKARVLGAISDLHAADARYHDDCRKSFMSARSVSTAAQSAGNINEVEPAIMSTITSMKRDMLHIWNSVEVHKLYKEHGGELCSRRTLLSKLSDILGSDILILSGAGFASLILFRNKASTVINLIASDEDDTSDLSLQRLAKTISEESKQLSSECNTYQTRMNSDIALESVSPTLHSLLSKISDKLNHSLPGALIGNMLTNAITKRPTPLQVALGVLVSRKSIIKHMYDYGVTCSYDEVNRFKTSAAKAAAIHSRTSGVANASSGLVQVVADNFDANISSQNRLVSTHSLAVLLTAKDDTTQSTRHEECTIRRVTRDEMKIPVAEDVPVERYIGPKKPAMPTSEAKRSVLPLRILAHQSVQLARTRYLDFSFLKAIACSSDQNVPEFAGFNTKLCRESGQAVQPATKAIYTPLIDMDPAIHDTMLTAMVEGQRMTKDCGQSITVFTNDQQLYRVAVDVTWVYPQKFSQFIPRLGGMHTLMSFVGCVGHLMADSGLEDVMKSAFGGVAHMLGGKKFPQNMRALRLVTEEVLRPILQQVETHCQLMETLESQSRKSPTTKLWVQNLVKPVFIMMVFVRAEREGDWPLHLLAMSEMIPYFFAAGHQNYARYGLYYLRSMERLHGNILDRFMMGEHVMRHKKGLWNGIWSDMFIESTFMRYGHGLHGIIGITLQPSTLKKWAYSMHTCSRLIQDLTDMSDGYADTEVVTHKEEMPSRMRLDAADRAKIREKLQASIDPMNHTDQSDGVVNIITGRIGPENVNVQNAVEIGQAQMRSFEESLPTGFNAALSKKLVTMAVMRKVLRIGSTDICDVNIIFSRVMGFQHSREINVHDILKYELAPVPTSMFDEKGDMRITKSKSTLKKSIQVEVSCRLGIQPDVTVVDGSAILWILHWPNRGTVRDFVDNFTGYILAKNKTSDIYVVFDRYHDFSIKSGTRFARAGKQASRRHRLSMNTPLPPQNVVLTVTENKVQLIDLICQQLTEAGRGSQSKHRLVITGSDPTPVEIHHGIQLPRRDLLNTQEEADVIMIHQVAQVAEAGSQCINVISDDTDVFVLLMYHFSELNMQCRLTMEATSAGRALVDIGATVEKHKDIVKYLPAVHALTGCDTVAQLWGRGKGTAKKTLVAGRVLHSLGEENAAITDVIDEATAFIAACYGSKKTTRMSDVRQEVWSTKMAKPKLTKAPDLKALPPTTESFEQNVRRAHIQTAIWKSAANSTPPSLDPTQCGWTRDEASKSLIPIMLPPNVPLAPPEVLEMIRCGCSSQRPCYTALCRCTAAKLSCTMFCACGGETVCQNLPCAFSFLFQPPLNCVQVVYRIPMY